MSLEVIWAMLENKGATSWGQFYCLSCDPSGQLPSRRREAASPAEFQGDGGARGGAPCASCRERMECVGVGRDVPLHTLGRTLILPRPHVCPWGRVMLSCSLTRSCPSPAMYGAGREWSLGSVGLGGGAVTQGAALSWAGLEQQLGARAST